MSSLWKMAAHWKGAACCVWQVVQWHSLLSSGYSLLNWYFTLPQWQLASYSALKFSFGSCMRYGGRNFHCPVDGVSCFTLSNCASSILTIDAVKLRLLSIDGAAVNGLRKAKGVRVVREEALRNCELAEDVRTIQDM